MSTPFKNMRCWALFYIPFFSYRNICSLRADRFARRESRRERRLTGSGRHSIYLVVLGRDHHHHHHHTIIAISERRKQARSFLRGQERQRNAHPGLSKVRRGHSGPRRPGQSCGEKRHAWSSYLDELAWHRWGEVGTRTLCVCGTKNRKKYRYHLTLRSHKDVVTLENRASPRRRALDKVIGDVL